MQSGMKTRTAIYVREDIEYKRRKDLETKKSPNIWIEMETNRKKNMVTCCLLQRMANPNKGN